jgi:predicted GTPase
MSSGDMSSATFTSEFEAYSQWRDDLSRRIQGYMAWLNREGLNDAQHNLRLQQLAERIAEDKLHVAFIAEFSRGKSELINAIFLSDLKQRLLPSTAGRTTMCPTELLYDAAHPPHILLLPIETRADTTTISEYRKRRDAWTQVDMDINSPDSVVQAMQEVCRVKDVSVETATQFGLYHPEGIEDSLGRNEDGSVSIPAWRHAIINFPHPFLAKGLVVYDTPGLNAIGVEPELTFNLIPNAHAVLFVLSADAGVTKTDIDVWRNHINMRSTQRGRLVALNKIDGLWDELKSDDQINAEIDRQAKSCAQLLGIPASQVYPVSAQKGLQAKIQGDARLMARSRLADLEKALSEELISSKQDIVREQTEAELTDLLDTTRAMLDGRRASIDTQIDELKGLQGKNEDVVQHIMAKISLDKEAFERGLQQFQALRSVFSQHSVQLYGLIGRDSLKSAEGKARQAMIDSRFTKGIRDAMNGYFTSVDRNLEAAGKKIEEINRMMEAMYKKLNDEHGLARASVPPFSLIRYRREMHRLEEAYQNQINTVITFLTTEQHTLTTRFFESVATRAAQIFDLLNKEVELWLKAVMSPMESQIREHQKQLRRRLDSVKRIHQAADTLDERIGEVDQNRAELQRQLDELAGITAGFRQTLAFQATIPTPTLL